MPFIHARGVNTPLAPLVADEKAFDFSKSAFKRDT